MMMLSGLYSGCLIPPERGELPVTQNFPPEIDLETLDPPTPKFVVEVNAQQGEPCPFDLAVTITERDNCYVEVRLVADNKFSSVSLLHYAETVRLGLPTGDGEDCPEPPYTKRISLPADTRFFFPPLTTQPHTISLFVKDTTDDWLVPREMIGEGDMTDAGALAPMVGDTRDGTVVSYNWTVIFTQGVCRR